MLLPINITFQIIKISIINIALTKIHHSLEIRKEMKVLFARVSSKYSHLLPIASFNFESLGLSYSKFIVENDCVKSFCPFDHAFARFWKIWTPLFCSSFLQQGGKLSVQLHAGVLGRTIISAQLQAYARGS